MNSGGGAAAGTAGGLRPRDPRPVASAPTHEHPGVKPVPAAASRRAHAHPLGPQAHPLGIQHPGRHGPSLPVLFLRTQKTPHS